MIWALFGKPAKKAITRGCGIYLLRVESIGQLGGLSVPLAPKFLARQVEQMRHIAHDSPAHFVPHVSPITKNDPK